MTLIKSICLTGIAASLFAASCKLKEEQIRDQDAWQKKTDSIGNTMLDSIYKLESLRCDSIYKQKRKFITDSLLLIERGEK